MLNTTKNVTQDFFGKGLISPLWFRGEPKTQWLVQKERNDVTIYDPSLRFITIGVTFPKSPEGNGGKSGWDAATFAQIAMGSQKEMQALREGELKNIDRMRLFISPVAYETTSDGAYTVAEGGYGLIVREGRTMAHVLGIQGRIDETKLFNGFNPATYFTDKENLLAGQFDTMGFFEKDAPELRFEAQRGGPKEKER